MNKYRNDLPQPVPQRLRSLPIQNGFPVPWFVAEVSEGVYDFRLIGPGKLESAIRRKSCWICGQRLGAYLAFPIGPMCCINRTISEPPSHTECAEWSIKACPFLAQRQEYRRETNLPDGIKEPGGIVIARQPGAICLWVTNKYDIWKVENGLIFKLGDPLQIKWFREGREATREEVLKSIDSGYPILYEAAAIEGEKAIASLEQMKADAMKLLPA
jgi:hypothetical protein